MSRSISFTDSYAMNSASVIPSVPRLFSALHASLIDSRSWIWLSVSARGKWGNPWSVAEWHSLLNTLPYDDARAVAADCFYSAMVDRVSDPDYLEHEHPGFYPPLDQIRDELAGKNLACWCPEDQPCHGDTLLKIANGQAL